MSCNVLKTTATNIGKMIIICYIGCLCLIGRLSAQEEITIYVNEFPKSLSDLDIHGPVKSVKWTYLLYWENSIDDRIIEYRYYNRIGQLVKDISIYERDSWDGDTVIYHNDTVIYCYTYDSLGRFESKFSPKGKFCRQAVYDSLGHFSHSVTHSDGISKPNRRYYYDDQGHCIRDEYIPTIHEDELGYMIMQHVFQYDSVGHCIATAGIVDGDTSYIERCQYDAKGNIVENFHSDRDWESRLLCFYEEDSKLVRRHHISDGELEEEDFFEYDEQNRLVRIKSWKKGRLSIVIEYLYDSFNNCIEENWFGWKLDQSPGATMKYLYEYEYFDSEEK